MLRQLTAIVMVFCTSFILFVNPVRAESFTLDSIDYSQLSDLYNNTQEIVNSAEEFVDVFVDIMDKAEDIITIVTIGGTAVCVVGSVASTSIFPPAAAILPYCSAIGILDSSNAVTKVIKKPQQAKQAKQVWNIFSHAF